MTRAADTGSGRKRRRGARRQRGGRGWKRGARTAVETGALLGAALTGVISWLGRSAQWFTGASLWANLLPFAGAVLSLALAVALALWGWLAVRRWLGKRWALAPVAVAVAAAAGAGWFASRPVFHADVRSLRTLVGGMAEAERTAVAHQVFAAYRRADLGGLERMLERTRVYESTVHEAAAAFGVDPEVLVGVGAAESAFDPRDSADGGQGLFQITAPPAAAVQAARNRLAVDRLDPRNQRHNAFLGAATFRRYLDEMHGDLFLGLLAYNIGPRNGGLRAIMRQYGARDFVTIQPYLQHLPRDYPIRVLSAALAYRVWRREGRLLPYAQADNAMRIQRIGIPGLG